MNFVRNAQVLLILYKNKMINIGKLTRGQIADDLYMAVTIMTQIKN